MTTSRRDFLETSATGIALLIGISQLGCHKPALAGGDDPFAPNQWLRIGPDGRVTVINDKSEMGQGASSAIPLIVAEELGVPWDAVSVEHAKPGPSFDDMGTSGSDSVAGRWKSLRVAAASAREMLIGAAAAKWRVPPAECVAEKGFVKHPSSRREASFGSLVAAASKLAVPASPTLKPDSGFTLVGTRVPRLDTRSAVTGAKQYGLDVRIPGMLRATIARCPVPSGKLTRWSGEKAKQVPGVRQVVQVSNGIAVVADTTWAALKGRDVLELVWDEEAGRGVDSAALWTQLERGFGTVGKAARQEGTPDGALAGAARRIDAEYRYPFQAHAAVESLNAVAHVTDGGAEIWAGTQNPNRVQTDAAKLLGCATERVVVNVLPLGGAFGRRISPDFVLEAVEVSRAARAPVQLVWSREDDLTHDMYQSAAIVRMRAGLDPAGTIVGWSHQIADFHLSMFGDFDPATFKPAEDGEPWGGIDTPYAFPALDVRIARQRPPVRTGAWRSVFYPSSVMARECFLDEVAHATGKDPVALRLELLGTPNPVTRQGVTIDNRSRLKAVVSLAAEKGGWGTPLPNVEPGRTAGRGVACNEYHRRTVVANVAEVSVGAAGDVIVHRIVCAMDCGRPVSLDGIEAQIEGGTMWALSTLLGREITFAAGRTEQKSFADFPVLRISQAPRVEAHIVPSTLPPFGVGEQPVPGAIPAVLNAIFAATGRRIRRVPIT
ncbi:MAG: molybdopterin cofactor-binding domain-containing protein [Gemmatimonadota bacterium]